MMSKQITINVTDKEFEALINYSRLISNADYDGSEVDYIAACKDVESCSYAVQLASIAAEMAQDD